VDLPGAYGVDLGTLLPEEPEDGEVRVRLRRVEDTHLRVLPGECLGEALVLAPHLVLAVQVEGGPEASGRVEGGDPVDVEVPAPVLVWPVESHD